ncbi:MAG: hypothetical protein Q8N51_04805 [Gammaproteobacteria bacterium]|nr:hypothetical protein [Gammaproteobacteria bacterium]
MLVRRVLPSGPFAGCVVWSRLPPPSGPAPVPLSAEALWVRLSRRPSFWLGEEPAHESRRARCADWRPGPRALWRVFLEPVGAFVVLALLLSALGFLLEALPLLLF